MLPSCRQLGSISVSNFRLAKKNVDVLSVWEYVNDRPPTIPSSEIGRMPTLGRDLLDIVEGCEPV